MDTKRKIYANIKLQKKELRCKKNLDLAAIFKVDIHAVKI